MSPAKKSKKRKSSKETKLEALFLSALATLGTSIGVATVDEINKILSHDNSQRMEEQQRPREDQTRQPQYVPEGDLPYGDEPKQRLRFSLIDDKGRSYSSWSYNASLREAAFHAYAPGALQPKEGQDNVLIEYQFQPSSPMYIFNVDKQRILKNLLCFDPDASAKDLGPVKHIKISPETDSNKLNQA